MGSAMEDKRKPGWGSGGPSYPFPTKIPATRGPLIMAGRNS